MTKSEYPIPNEQAVVDGIFQNALNKFRTTGSPRLRAVATHVGESVIAGNLLVLPDQNQFFNNSISGFGIVRQFPTPEGRHFGTAITINTKRVPADEPEAMEADLVRSLGVAYQFLFTEEGKIFCNDRLVDVYARAIDLQAEWLSMHPTPFPALIDPRISEREEIAQRLLGERFYVDIGFDDFMAQIGKTEVSQLKDPAYFWLNRNNVALAVFEEAEEVYGPNLRHLTADQRAKICAPFYRKKLQEIKKLQESLALQN